MIAAAEGLGADDSGTTERAASIPRDRWAFWPVLAVVLVGLAATAALTVISSSLYRSNEQRLLKLRARDVGTVLTSALPSIQTPLASAAALADATNGNVPKFMRLVAPYVGSGAGATFASVSLWRVGATGRGPLAVVGSAPALPSSGGQTSRFFARSSTSHKLSVIGLLGGARPRLGYAFTGTPPGAFAAYGESALPSNRYSPVQKNSAFNDINFALYLGRSTNPADLLIASVRRLPLTGRHLTVHTPFGDTTFAITVAARGPLGGSLPQSLPWAIAIVGTLLTLGAVALSVRLIDGRRRAERLARRIEEIAEENRRLYAEQRTIAQTLQHALLPDTLPQPPGLQTSARYEAGVEGVDIGGDWYDLIALDERRLLLVVGDVSGRGLRAATTMAALRFAIRAYVAEGDDPATFLPKLSRLVSVRTDGQLATILCAVIDIPSRRVTVTSAGHLPPLLVSSEGSQFVETGTGVPVGVDAHPSYSSTAVSAPAGATVLAFTDGLVERRGESIDAGLERLRSQVSPNHVPLDQLLTQVLSDLRKEASDDTAIVGIRWMI